MQNEDDDYKRVYVRERKSQLMNMHTGQQEYINRKYQEGKNPKTKQKKVTVVSLQSRANTHYIANFSPYFYFFFLMLYYTYLY